MIRTLFLFAFFFTFCLCVAQTADKKTAISLYGCTIQYKGELGNQFLKTDNLLGTIGFSVAQYISPSFNLGLMYRYGDVNFINVNEELSGSIGNMNLFIHYKFFNGKIFKENARIGPYLVTGFGGSDWKERKPKKTHFTDAFLPLGAGFKIHISNSFDILLQCEYHFTMSDLYDNSDAEKGKDAFLHTMIGLSYNISEGKDSDKDNVKDKKDHCPGTPVGVAVDNSGCPLDRDSDGVADYLDRCPDFPGQYSALGCPDQDGDSIADGDDHCPAIAGPTLTFGCPDRDLDGVLDADDACPDMKGIVSLHGCPDRDEDGVADKDDACPDEKGIAALQGCPDRDGDGIADKDDLCPDSTGIAANKGCPEVKEEVKKLFEQALTGLQFETGKETIKKSSYHILDEVVKAMIENHQYKLVISGHTDNTGSAAKNLELSEKRAAAAKYYLTSHGIEEARINSGGYGDTLPVADNKTKNGRAKNRRVEFKVVF
ncbi:MAG: OmpA family protein [Bacteroidota bacterium]